jgi:hypothetical protein
MKILAQKTLIYSMIGLMQVGLFASIAEAATFHNNSSQQVVQFNSRHDRDRDRDQDRQREHDKRLRKENERHEREMRRRPHERERDWHERQERERERHDRELRDIAALLIGIVIGSSSK